MRVVFTHCKWTRKGTGKAWLWPNVACHYAGSSILPVASKRLQCRFLQWWPLGPVGIDHIVSPNAGPFPLKKKKKIVGKICETTFPLSKCLQKSSWACCTRRHDLEVLSSTIFNFLQRLNLLFKNLLLSLGVVMSTVQTLAAFKWYWSWSILVGTDIYFHLCTLFFTNNSVTVSGFAKGC